MSIANQDQDHLKTNWQGHIWLHCREPISTRDTCSTRFIHSNILETSDDLSSHCDRTLLRAQLLSRCDFYADN